MNRDLKIILDEYKHFPQVKAIAIGGSSTANTSDNISDTDIYIFVSENIPVEQRLELTKKYSTNYEVGGEYFGSGDEYFADSLNRQLDVMFWNINWFKDVITNVWQKHYPSNGYTTCFLFTLSNFDIIYDPDNFLKNLRDKISTPYPKELKKNIIKRNMMLLKDKPFASYYEQIAKALKRNDIVSINHRIAAFTASYFDIIFARNELLHPGEKRLIQYAKDNCKILPDKFEENLSDLLNCPKDDILKILDNIIKNLKIVTNNLS